MYLTWARIEKSSHADPPTSTSPLAAQPLVLQYVFFLALCGLSTLAFHLPIRLLCKYPPYYLSSDGPGLKIVPHYPHPNPLSTALLVSSCTKLFPLLLIVWEYDLPSSASAVSWAVIVNNVAALEILMDCGYARSALLIAIGAGCRALTSWGLLSAVGMGDRLAWSWTDVPGSSLVPIILGR